MKTFNLILLLNFLLLFSGLKAQNLNQSEKIGSALIKSADFQVILGNDYNTITTKNYGEIHLKHKYVDSLNLQSSAEKDFKASFRKLPKTSIEIKNLEIASQLATANFSINIKEISLPQSCVKIILDNKKFPKDEVMVIKE